jgi:murein DD-endopeptidase MepM/ murein hydrolase activator NlpD
MINALLALPKLHRFLIVTVLAVLLLVVLIPSQKSSSPVSQLPELEIGKRYSLDINYQNLASSQPQEPTEELETQTFTIGKGDNLALIFKRAGLSPQETYRVSRAGELAKKLLKMKPGESLALTIDKAGKLAQLDYAFSVTDTLRIVKTPDNTFSSAIHSKPVDTRINYAQGQINNSFWNAGVEAKLTDNQIMSLAGVFGWDVDFALGIRKGDSFYVMFEERFVDGEFIENGDIVAAQFVNRGETYTAIRYSDGNFYTPEGRSMRKSFLRAPVNFKYISSSFKPRRFHPVQKRWKAHRGVDYAASRGTPVMAAGDGKVIKSAYNKFNGHYVFIQHGEKYVTKYLHFTKRKVKTGQSVKQGQIIGTVGATGLASGPHLHYEFLVDGVHRNPRTVKLPKAQPIAKKERDKFQLLATQRLAQLDNNKRIMLAMR